MMRTNLVVFLSTLLISNQLFAWAKHHLITEAALSSIAELNNKKVLATPFLEFCQRMGFHSVQEFNESIKIRKDFVFKPKLNEDTARVVKVIDVLTTYSDEPDWDMDTELFGAEQYPELWRDEYTMMGGKVGTTSQAFRHMYWQSFSVSHPLATFRLPLSKIFSNMGFAPQRAQTFIALARRAKNLGEYYWSLRFLANALHYPEDVMSPFHSTQTPSKLFMTMPLTDKEYGSGFSQGFSGYVTQATHVVSYYHFSFEDYIGEMMAKNHMFVDDLKPSSLGSSMPIGYSGDAESFVVELAIKYSVPQSAHAARASIQFFPKLKASYLEVDPHAYMNEAWWRETIEAGMADTPAKRDYFNVVKTMFTPLGEAIRQIVLYETRGMYFKN